MQKTVFFFSCLFLISSSFAFNEMDLGGSDWHVVNANGSVKASATVPGQIQLDLMAAKIISDPYYRFNDDLDIWIAMDNWTYSRSFNLEESAMSSKKVWLACHGIDTVANISVNGHMVGTTNNQHRKYYFDIKSAVQSGSNMIVVAFESAATYSIRQANNYPYSVHGGGNYFKANRNFIRKCQSDFGWDWGPAFVPVGIWKNISVLSFNEAYISDVVPQIFPDSNGGFDVTVTVYLQAADSGAGGKVTVSVANKEASGMFTASAPGETSVVLNLHFNKGDVKLWWPNGYGDQPLYEMTVMFHGNKEEMQNKTHNVGFRKLELVQEPLPDKEEGLSFYFSVNDVPVFVKGSNWIPTDAFTGRVTYEYLHNQLYSAVLSHQNMVRVWGGGIYQTRDFYDICDKLGIMVWQEFMFGDALYPRDKAFLETVAEEIRHQVRRLAHHPSIALWSGNNENQDAGSKSGPIYLIDYSVLYDDTVHATLITEDRARPYWPSSPSNGALVDNPDMGLYIQKWGESSDPHYGDVHRYDYNDLCTDVTKFPRPRFASEYGFQSYPSLETLKPVSMPSDWDNNSTLMLHRQHHPNGDPELAAQMARFFHKPDNSDTEIRFGDFIYLTQVVQALCIQAESEHYRRIRTEQNAYTMGALYWQLNDIWQAQSWASLEYGGRWKLLHYFAVDFFAPVLVSPFQMDGRICAYVANDLTRPLKGELKVDVWKWTGTIDHSFSVSVNIAAQHADKFWNVSVSEALNNNKPNEVLLFLSFTESGNSQPTATNVFYPSAFTDVNLMEAKISAGNFSSVSGMQVKFTLTSTAMAPYVYLHTDNVGYFSDNGFLMVPNSPMEVTFTGFQEVDASQFEKDLKIRSVRDTYSG